MNSWNGKSVEFWEIFIDIIRKREYLYKKSEKFYSNRQVVRNTWDAIATSMSRSGFGPMTG